MHLYVLALAAGIAAAVASRASNISLECGNGTIFSFDDAGYAVQASHPVYGTRYFNASTLLSTTDAFDTELPCFVSSRSAPTWNSSHVMSASTFSCPDGTSLSLQQSYSCSPSVSEDVAGVLIMISHISRLSSPAPHVPITQRSVLTHCSCDGGQDDAGVVWTAGSGANSNASTPENDPLAARPWPVNSTASYLYGGASMQLSGGTRLPPLDIYSKPGASLPLLVNLNPTAANALSLIASPGVGYDSSVYLSLDVGPGATDACPAACNVLGDFTLHRYFMRLDAQPTPPASSTLTFISLLALHASDWRPAVAAFDDTFHVLRPAAPPSVHTLAVDVAGAGMGYANCRGRASDVNATLLRSLGAGGNWDASFPWAVLGVPYETATPTDVFETCTNHADGGPAYPCYNLTYDGVDSFYSSLYEAVGARTVTYWNYYEFGQGMIPLSAPLGQVCDFAEGVPLPPTDDDSPGHMWDLDHWNNVTDCRYNTLLRSNFSDALLLESNQASNTSIWNSAFNATLNDPGTPSYATHHVHQIQRHLAFHTNSTYVAGVLVDRLDWSGIYHWAGDDGISWARNHTAAAVLRGFISTGTAVRDALHGAGRVHMGSLLMYRADQAAVFDGFYNEFGDIWGIAAPMALLSVRGKPSVAWNHNETWFGNPKIAGRAYDVFLQAHLQLGVMPTLPWHTCDHCLQDTDDGVNAVFLRYAPLFSALKGREWALHAFPAVAGQCSCDGVSSSAPLMNAFLLPGSSNASASAMAVFMACGCAGEAGSVNVTVRAPPAFPATTAQWSVLQPAGVGSGDAQRNAAPAPGGVVQVQVQLGGASTGPPAALLQVVFGV